MVTNFSPDIVRLVSEADRTVKIPLSGAVQLSELPAVSKICMGSRPLVLQEEAKLRLQNSVEYGKWYCKRTINGSLPYLHKDDVNESGSCKQIMPAGNVCGYRLQPRDTHLDELAEAFSFLGNINGQYTLGKFGLVSTYINEAVSRHSYFDKKRANNALVLYSLLENHGDFIIPLLALIKTRLNSAKELDDALDSSYAEGIQYKLDQLANSDLVHNQAFHAYKTRLEERFFEWTGKKSDGAPLTTNKTKQGYRQRAVKWLSDLNIVETAGDRSINTTDLGDNLVDGFVDENLMNFNSSVNCFPILFETAFDCFGITMSRFRDSLNLSASIGTLERLLFKTFLPKIELVPYREISHLISEDLRFSFTCMMNTVSKSVTVDTLRLALFAKQIGVGIPVHLDLSYQNEQFDPNQNAIYEVAKRNIRMYSIGTTRSGRRGWNVSLNQR